jgi:hypothetical protein
MQRYEKIDCELLRMRINVAPNICEIIKFNTVYCGIARIYPFLWKLYSDGHLDHISFTVDGKATTHRPARCSPAQFLN